MRSFYFNEVQFIKFFTSIAFGTILLKKLPIPFAPTLGNDVMVAVICRGPPLGSLARAFYRCARPSVALCRPGDRSPWRVSGFFSGACSQCADLCSPLSSNCSDDVTWFFSSSLHLVFSVNSFFLSFIKHYFFLSWTYLLKPLPVPWCGSIDGFLSMAHVSCVVFWDSLELDFERCE